MIIVLFLFGVIDLGDLTKYKIFHFIVYVCLSAPCNALMNLYAQNKRTRESDGNGEVADEHGVMDNPDQDDQGLSTELENAKKELSDIHSKLIKVRSPSADIRFCMHSDHYFLNFFYMANSGEKPHCSFY